MKTDDVPILTDDLSSVEVLINPVTSQPYIYEDSVFAKGDSKIWFSESTAVKLGLLLALTMFWAIYFRSVWVEKIPTTAS